MDELKSFLSKIYPVPEEQLDQYVVQWSEYAAPKKTILTEHDQTERYLYFVRTGIQKSYYLNDGKQHIMFFAYPPSFSGVVESFLNQTPSKYTLEALTDSTFYRISFTQHTQLVNKHRGVETLFRKITERFLLGVIERHHEFLAYDAETRLTIFMKRSAHLLNMVSQKDLASYLRIDPTNFSKMMNRIRI